VNSIDTTVTPSTFYGRKERNRRMGIFTAYQGERREVGEHLRKRRANAVLWEIPKKKNQPQRRGWKRTLPERKS